MIRLKYLLGCALAAASAQAARAQEPEAARVLPVLPAQAAPGLSPAQRAQQVMEAEQLKTEARERRTPEGMLWQFSTAINDNNLVLAARSVEGGQANADLRKLQAKQEKAPRNLRLDVTPLFEHIDKGQREFEWRVAVSLRSSGLMGGDALLQSKTTFIERLTLRRDKSGEWKIVPRQAPPEIVALNWRNSVQDQAQAIEEATRAAQSEDDGFLNTWARAMLRPRDILVRSTARDSLSNIKQLGLGIMQLSQDYDEVLSFSTANFQDRLMPYIKSTQLFLAPALDEDKAIAYAINPAIAGKSLASFDDVAHTVAIYEAGPDGRPLFRFNGKAAVGFMDGHAALVGPEEMPGLIEKPKPKSVKAS